MKKLFIAFTAFLIWAVLFSAQYEVKIYMSTTKLNNITSADLPKAVETVIDKASFEYTTDLKGVTVIANVKQGVVSVIQTKAPTYTGMTLISAKVWPTPTATITRTPTATRTP